MVANMASIMHCVELGRNFEDLPEKIRPFIIYLDPLWKADKALGGIVRLYLETALECGLGTSAYLKMRVKIFDGSYLITEQSVPDFQAIIPKQTNAYDCGLFVLEYIESFWTDSSNFLEELQTKGSHTKWFPPSLIEYKRMMLTNIIMHLVNDLDLS